MKIPIGIKATIKAGGTVFWLEKPVVKKVRSRCNEIAVSLDWIDNDLKRLFRPWLFGAATLFSNNEEIVPADVYIDIEFIRYFPILRRYENAVKVNWFKDTIENRYIPDELSFRYYNSEREADSLFEKV